MTAPLFDIEASFDRVLAQHPMRTTIVFPEATEPRVLEAVCHLTRFARPVLLAPEADVREAAARFLGHVDPNRVAYALSEAHFLDPASRPDLLTEFAQAHAQAARSRGESLTEAEAREAVAHPALFGIWAVALGHADMVVAGACHEPKQFHRPMLRTLKHGSFACEAGIFVLPPEHPSTVYPQNIVVFGDTGVNAEMTPERLARVAVGTCAVARDLIPEDVLPTIQAAIVSHSNKGGDEGPSVELVREATALLPGILAHRVARAERYRSIHIEGELRVSVALSRRSASYFQHGAETPWAGPCNVIVCPSLDMGNLLYSLYGIRFPDARKFQVTFGVRSRGVSLAMDCTPEDIRLGVKATLIRLHRYGEWVITPKDTFFRRYRVLAINPGSTSTKLALYEGDREVVTQALDHPPETLAPFAGQPITTQLDFRLGVIRDFLMAQGVVVAELDAISARGGMLKPIPHGTYAVNNLMLEDLLTGQHGEHASNLGALLAHALTGDSGIPAYIVDPVVVDEVLDRVKVTGVKVIRRKVVSHALNQIASGHRFASERETFYNRLNLIICHMGGGISIGAHRKGRCIDVNNALDGEGPFTPERSGSLPVSALIDLCHSGRYSLAELKLLNRGRGGLVDLLGSSDLRELEGRLAKGDAEVGGVLEALHYQIAKWIASMVPAFDGEPVDQIILTGGMARSEATIQALRAALIGLGIGLTIYPGENEMRALAKGALRVLCGKETVREYT